MVARYTRRHRRDEYNGNLCMSHVMVFYRPGQDHVFVVADLLKSLALKCGHGLGDEVTACSRRSKYPRAGQIPDLTVLNLPQLPATCEISRNQWDTITTPPSNP